MEQKASHTVIALISLQGFVMWLTQKYFEQVITNNNHAWTKVLTFFNMGY
jgi:hypothetical protein